MYWGVQAVKLVSFVLIKYGRKRSEGIQNKLEGYISLLLQQFCFILHIFIWHSLPFSVHQSYPFTLSLPILPFEILHNKNHLMKNIDRCLMKFYSWWQTIDYVNEAIIDHCWFLQSIHIELQTCFKAFHNTGKWYQGKAAWYSTDIHMKFMQNASKIQDFW